jgi:predicted transcriptional regulator
MVYGVMTGNKVLQTYLREQYWAARDAGLTKKEAHQVAFQEMLQANDQGYIITEEGEFVEEEEIENPYIKVICSEEGPL